MGAMDFSFSEINGASSLLSVEPTTTNHVAMHQTNNALLYSTMRNNTADGQVATSSSSSGSSALSSGSGTDGSRTVQVGSEHQATIPQLMPPHTLQQYIEDTVDLSMPVWSANNHNLTNQQIDDFVKSSGDLKDSKSEDALPDKDSKSSELKLSSEQLKQPIFSEEQCLTVLCFNNFNLAKAKEELKHLRPVEGNYNGCGSRWWWCENDRISFENAFKLHGKHFVRLQEAVPHKSVGQVVDYYYRWKRQPIHSTVMDLFLERQREQQGNEKEKGGKQEADETNQNNNTPTASTKDKALSWWFDSEDDELLIALKRRKLDQQQQESNQDNSQSSKDLKKSLSGNSMFDLSTNKRMMLKRKVTDLIHLDGEGDDDNDENDSSKNDHQGKESKAGIKRSCKEIEKVTLNDDEDDNETSSTSTTTANGANATTNNGPKQPSNSSTSSTTSTGNNSVSQSSTDGMRLNVQQLCHLVEVSRDWEQYRRRLNGKTVALHKQLQQLKQNTNWEVLNSYQRDLTHLRSSKKCAKLMYLLNDQQKRPKSVNWSSSEEEMFLLCARRYGIKDLEVLSVMIGTKTVSQVKNFIPVAKIKHRLDHLLDHDRLDRNATNRKTPTPTVAMNRQISTSSMEQSASNSQQNGATNSFDLRLRPLEADKTIRDFIANTANFISSHPEGIAMTSHSSNGTVEGSGHSGQNGYVNRRPSPNSISFPPISATQTTATALPHVSRTPDANGQSMTRPPVSGVLGQSGTPQTSGINGNKLSLQRHLLAHAAMLSQKQQLLQNQQANTNTNRNETTIVSQPILGAQSIQLNSHFQNSQPRDRMGGITSARTESSSSQSRPNLFRGSSNSISTGANVDNTSFSARERNSSPHNLTSLFPNAQQPMLQLMQQQHRRSGLDLSSALSQNRSFVATSVQEQAERSSGRLSASATEAENGNNGGDDDDDIVEVFPNK